MTNKDNAFNLGLRETLKFKKATGNANAPAEYVTPDGFKLGNWQYSQNSLYNKNKLAHDRIKKLEDVGFTWKKGKSPDDSFELGFKMTLEYKDIHGDANAQSTYITDKGYRLGSWQGYIRNRYKLGKLDPERIKKLEEIGFKLIKRKSILNENNDYD